MSLKTLLTIILHLIDLNESKSFMSCKHGWTQLDDYCYYKSQREMDFYSAERFCRVRLGSHLPILKEEKVAKFYYNLLFFHSSPYDTWLGIIPLKQLNQSWKWLDGSDVVHDDMRQRFIVDDDWGFDEGNISQNTTYKDAINSIAEHFYLENLHCTLLILSDDNDPAKFDFTRCDKTSHFYCQKRADLISATTNVHRTVLSQYHSNVFLVLIVITLTALVLLLLLFGFFDSRNHTTSTEATAFYANQ